MIKLPFYPEISLLSDTIIVYGTLRESLMKKVPSNSTLNIIKDNVEYKGTFILPQFKMYYCTKDKTFPYIIHTGLNEDTIEVELMSIKASKPYTLYEINYLLDNYENIGELYTTALLNVQCVEKNIEVFGKIYIANPRIVNTELLIPSGNFLNKNQKQPNLCHLDFSPQE